MLIVSIIWVVAQPFRILRVVDCPTCFVSTVAITLTVYTLTSDRTVDRKTKFVELSGGNEIALFKVVKFVILLPEES